MARLPFHLAKATTSYFPVVRTAVKDSLPCKVNKHRWFFSTGVVQPRQSRLVSMTHIYARSQCKHTMMIDSW